MKSLQERFWAKVQKSDGCWEWIGVKTPPGYGVIRAGVNHPWFRKRRMMAHRLSYELAFGEFDQELCVLHHCDNPSCVRPSHLFLGTHADNIRDKCAKRRQARGLTHGTHTHPESIARGEQQGSHKLTSAQVREIRKRRAAETLTDLLDIDSVGVRVILDIRGSLPMSDETRRAIQSVELALQEELWCPVMLRLGMGLHVPDMRKEITCRC